MTFVNRDKGDLIVRDSESTQEEEETWTLYILMTFLKDLTVNTISFLGLI